MNLRAPKFEGEANPTRFHRSNGFLPPRVVLGALFLRGFCEAVFSRWRLKNLVGIIIAPAPAFSAILATQVYPVGGDFGSSYLLMPSEIIKLTETPDHVGLLEGLSRGL